MASDENLFKRVARSLLKHGLIAGKAEAFLLHLLSTTKQDIRYPIMHNKILEVDNPNEINEEEDENAKSTAEKGEDIVISDLEPDAPSSEESGDEQLNISEESHGPYLEVYS